MKGVHLLVSNWIVATGLETVVNQLHEFRVVGVSHTISECKKTLSTTENIPDICVIYIEHDEVIPSFLFELKNTYENISTVVLGGDVNRQTILQVMASKTEVYIYKDCSKNEFRQALFASANSQKYYCGKILDKMLEIPTQQEHCELVGLTDREIEIVRLIANGNSTKETADLLGLSPHTVATHRKNIFRKLEINSGSELVRYALENNLLKAL